jgi:hypothetical protein
MLERLIVAWVIYRAHRRYQRKKMRTKLDMYSYQQILINVRDFLSAGLDGVEEKEYSLEQVIDAALIESVLDGLIEDLDALLRINPLVIGKIDR